MRSEVQALPKIFLERLRKIIPSHKFDAVANTFSLMRPTTFRVNTLKASVEKVREKLRNEGFRLSEVSWYPEAFILQGKGLRELQETEVYKSGEIYVQGLSSMIPPLVLNPQPGEKILDLTAAPGSKTTQMVCLMKGQGRILANDNNKIRFYRLKANLELQGVNEMVEPTLRYGESLGRVYPTSFDRVLVDAPCSAEGRFSAKEPSSYAYWKLNKVHEMERKQRKLLLSGILALKPGGVLVYSTCTFAPEENEGVLNDALEKLGEQIELESISFSLPNLMNGLKTWEEKTFHPSVTRSLRILPNAQMDGFFVAKMRKR
ncbi:MAG: RsmB/NOP family class I SAM-dependent RNA methyltransferase [Chlamydiae bacterium]|nr:RsmB/NOP family class I SAM-dependent RNA methyltransferase [Chlamydiota bacterium]MBI3266564.1 RsmB/NOP family class I SAM-dependent RNA methyltransferase [Chlamydiota bacterium]